MDKQMTIEEKYKLVERQMRLLPVDEVLTDGEFVKVKSGNGEHEAYCKRFGDVACLITTVDALLPKGWDDTVALSFMEFWTNGDQMSYIHDHGDGKQAAMVGELIGLTMLVFTFTDENSILEYIKKHPPEQNMKKS